MTKKRQSADEEPWWRSEPTLSARLVSDYGITVERAPWVCGFELTPTLLSGPPAALWVAVGRDGLTLLVVDDYALPYVLHIEVVAGGTRNVRITARQGGPLLTADDLRGLPLTTPMADLAALGDVFLQALNDHLATGAPLDVGSAMVVVDGGPSDALLHLVGQLQKRRDRDGQTDDLRQQVVDIYLRAISGELGDEAKRAPRKAVSKMVFKSEAHVGRLLVEARREGRLEKTKPGRKNRLDGDRA